MDPARPSEHSAAHMKERLRLNQDTSDFLTRDLVARSEWFGFAGQTVAITASIFVDKVSKFGWWLLIGLAFVHAALAALSWYKGKGPFTAGAPWGAVWLSSAILMPVIVAYIVTSPG